MSVSPAAQGFAEPKALPAISGELAPLWTRVIRAEDLSPLLRAVLINSTLESLEGGRATVVCSGRYAADAQKKWRASITELLSREAGTAIELTIRSADGAAAMVEAPVAAASEAEATMDAASVPIPPRPASVPSPARMPAQSLNNAADHPLVKQALELFGGRIVDIQPRRRG